MAVAGYAGKAVWQKLGFGPNLTVVALDAPPDYAEMLGGLPAGVQLLKSAPEPYAAVHLFVVSKAELDRRLKDLRGKLSQQGMIWVSWPKKASKRATDITDNVIREIALPLGLVDVKVCAVDEVWSGLKLVIRKTERA